MERDSLLQMISASEYNLRELMETYGSDVWNYAFFLTRNREEADDISQEVFLKAYRHIDFFRGQASIKTWLLTITRNTAFSWRRKFLRRKALLEAGGTAIPPHPSAETEVMDRQYSDSIWNIIMSLPDPYRETLVLDLKYGLSIAELSGLLRVAPGTVKSRLSRARDKVRRALEMEDQE